MSTENSKDGQAVPVTARQIYRDAQDHAASQNEYDVQAGLDRFTNWLQDRATGRTYRVLGRRLHEAARSALGAQSAALGNSGTAVVQGAEAQGPRYADGEICAMLGVDIVGYTDPSRRDEETRQHMRASLLGCLKDAFRRSAIPWDACFQQNQGDGLLMILPPDSAPTSLVEPLPSRLQTLIGRYNRMSAEPARMRVRLAMHIGPVYRDEHGVIGDDIAYLTRMLDSGPLRRDVADTQSEIAVAVSADFYKVIIEQGPSVANPDEFRHVRARVKGSPVDMWLLIPSVGL